MKNGEKPIVNPWVVLREEFDDWAVLFNPDTARGFGLNPTGVYLWKIFDGKHTTTQLITALRQVASGVPADAVSHIHAFIDELAHHDLLTYEIASTAAQSTSITLRNLSAKRKPHHDQDAYEPPKLIDFIPLETARGNCTYGSITGTGYCGNGAHTTGGYCGTGTSPMNNGCAVGPSTTGLGCKSGSSAGGTWGCSTGTPGTGQRPGWNYVGR